MPTFARSALANGCGSGRALDAASLRRTARPSRDDLGHQNPSPEPTSARSPTSKSISKTHLGSLIDIEIHLRDPSRLAHRHRNPSPRPISTRSPTSKSISETHLDSLTDIEIHLRDPSRLAHRHRNPSPRPSRLAPRHRNPSPRPISTSDRSVPLRPNTMKSRALRSSTRRKTSRERNHATRSDRGR